jgi:uncharacterized protein
MMGLARDAMLRALHSTRPGTGEVSRTSMQLLDGTLVLSATDLVGQTACGHLTTLEKASVEGGPRRPVRRDPVLDVLSRRGQERERLFLDRHRAAGRTIVELTAEPVQSIAGRHAAAEATRQAMRDGAGILYQATLFDGEWFGRADFLVRVDEPSALGAWSYEVADAKLSREVKGGAILQLCLYSELLAAAQGKEPANVHVITGDGKSHAYRLADFAAYYRMVKRRLIDRLAAKRATYPEPVDHCRVCGWWSVCADQRRADDHLSLVAGMSRLQTRRLERAGITTLDALARANGVAVPGIGIAPLEALKHQARLQRQQREDGLTRRDLLPHDPEHLERGLAGLPAPSPGDLFLDFESDPWIDDAGREYLMGAVVADEGEPRYIALWGHTAEEERAAFDELMALIVARRERWPDMHVYHYGAYENGALKRLMGRHAIRDEELDALLRDRVLVDLYATVRESMRVSEESYSIKKVEKLYDMTREGPVTRPGFALVAYEEWLEDQDPARLQAIADYNKDDCVSVWRLRDYLEGQRRELEATVGPLPRPVNPDKPPSEAALQANAENEARERALRDGVPADRAARTPEQQARWLLAALVEWHRRDARPEWWRYFFLRGRPVEELVAAPDALGGLVYEKVVGTVARSEIHRYRYDVGQEHKFTKGDKPVDPADEGAPGEVWAVDHTAGTIDLKRGIRSARAHPQALIPAKPIMDKTLRAGIARVADWVIANGIDADGPFRAVRDLLLGRPPRIDGGGPLTRPGEDLVAAARRIARSLDHTTLPVQGPPGTGKTYTGARMILDLVRAGRKVGITAQSHRAIGNLVRAVLEAAEETGAYLRVAQKAEDGDIVVHERVDQMVNPKAAAAALEDGLHFVAAGTPWLFAAGEMTDTLDVLFVDEAGQMSLANVVAMAGCARSIVLLGDPNQLPQVTQGSHPEGAEKSALEHVLRGRAVIPPDEGLFIPDTRRLHPSLCRFTSDAFYDGQLFSHETTSGQSLLAGSRLGTGAGVVYLPLDHAGNSARSQEEAGLCADVVAELLGCEWVDHEGRRRPVTLDDILVVAPYNAHVAEIAARVRAVVGRDARVGTVDKFQGQEAAVVLYAMATSSAEDAPRAMDFLYSRNRLNVATSRARCKAVLICSPDLLQAHCRRPEEMRMLNAFCRLVEMA